MTTSKQQENSLQQIDAKSIADNLEIRNIFKLDFWTVEEGIDYLQGLFREYVIGVGASEFLMLDGKRYSSIEHKAEINQFNVRYSLLREIWDRTKKKRDKYPPRVFIDWGMKHRELSKMSWFDSALEIGLLEDIMKPIPAKTTDDQKLTNSERLKLLTIIAGILKEKYKYTDQGFLKKLMTDIQKSGLTISENSLSKHYHAAISLLEAAAKE